MKSIQRSESEELFHPHVLPGKQDEWEGVRFANSSSTGELVVTVVGPALGAPDKRNYALHVSCHSGEIAVVATITEYAGYDGAALNNGVWRPIVVMRITSPNRPVPVSVSWKLQSAFSQPLSVYPGYGARPFPVRSVGITPSL